MRYWVWKMAFAALGGIFVACSTDGDCMAGSTLETENSIAVTLTVQREGGIPAARSKVFVRPAYFLAGANNYAFAENQDLSESDSPVVASDSALGILNLVTDSLWALWTCPGSSPATMSSKPVKIWKGPRPGW